MSFTPVVQSRMQTYVVEFHDEPVLQFNVHQTRAAAGRIFWVQVLPNTAAEAAGVATGDVILRVNGQHTGGWHDRDLFDALLADLPVAVEFGVAVSARSCVSPLSISCVEDTRDIAGRSFTPRSNAEHPAQAPSSSLTGTCDCLCVCCFAFSHLSSHVQPCSMHCESPLLNPFQLSVHGYVVLHCFCFTLPSCPHLRLTGRMASQRAQNSHP